VSGRDETELRTVLGKALEASVDDAPLLDVERPVGATDPAVWSTLVEFGLPGLAVDENVGGAGAPARLLYVSIEEAAKALAPAPLVPTTIALSLAVETGATDVVARIVSGAPAVFAVPVDDSGWATDPTGLPQWDGARVTGVVPLVAGAPAAEVLLVLAQHCGSGEQVLLLVDPTVDGVLVEAHEPLDLTATIGAVQLNDAVAQVITTEPRLKEALLSARLQALLAVASDSVGVAARALAMAVSWAGEREQFGRAIGSFQAISHRCADMLVAVEAARSQVLAAAELPTVAGSEHLVELAAAAALDAAVWCAEAAIQIHGGIGFTWEHPVHLLLRRAQANAVAVGRAEALRERAADRLLTAHAASQTHQTDHQQTEYRQ
jgi:acyl-CoA dehydrogenase